MFATQVAPDQVAAIVFEPQQGEGGFLPAPQEWVEGLRRIADEHGIVLVADEVQTGFARTGRMFAMEHYGVEPDLITIAKSLAGGLPLSGVLGKAAIMDAPHEGAIGGTFVGNPVAQAAAVAVLDVIEQEGLVERANVVGDTIRDAHARLAGVATPGSATSAGSGAMLALELVEDPATKEPAPALASAVIEAAVQRGLLLLKAGVHGNCVRVLCPLVISDARARGGARRLGAGARRDARLARSQRIAQGRLRSVLVGQLIADRYELKDVVGTGGMSSVFCAHDTLLERDVALKILHEHHARDDDYVERFRHEARAVAQLSHPNIVTVIDRGEDDGRQYIVFEYVQGENLKELVEQGRAAGATHARAGPRGRARARVRARAGARAPRREAAERAALGRRTREGDRLRHRPLARRARA